jgi:hypothetical protein
MLESIQGKSELCLKHSKLLNNKLQKLLSKNVWIQFQERIVKVHFFRRFTLKVFIEIASDPSGFWRIETTVHSCTHSLKGCPRKHFEDSPASSSFFIQFLVFHGAAARIYKNSCLQLFF